MAFPKLNFGKLLKALGTLLLQAVGKKAVQEVTEEAGKVVDKIRSKGGA